MFNYLFPRNKTNPETKTVSGFLICLSQFFQSERLYTDLKIHNLQNQNQAIGLFFVLTLGHFYGIIKSE